MDRRAREIAQAAARLLQQSGVVGEGDYEVALPMLGNWGQTVARAAQLLVETDCSQPAAQAMLGSLAESLSCLDQMVYYIARHGPAAIFAAFDGSDPQSLTAARRDLDAYAAVLAAHNPPTVKLPAEELPPRISPELAQALEVIRQELEPVARGRGYQAANIARMRRRMQALTVVRGAIVAACPGGDG